MNEHDLDNLKFLLTASPETLTDWYNSVSEDCHEYAKEILEMGSLEILDHYDEVALAKSVLQKFRLNT